MIRIEAGSGSRIERADADLPWLVADIGGTHARFGIVCGAGAAVEDVQQFAVGDFSTPQAAVLRFLEGLHDLHGAAFRAPCRAAWAVATAVDADRVQFTNSVWQFVPSELRAQLGLCELIVLNDFEALALSLPHLGPQQMRLHGAAPRRDATLAVVGPGTGLGVGAVMPGPCGWQAIAGEGGHASLSAMPPLEAAVIQQARRVYPHVSAERLISGTGLPVLHAALGEVLDVQAELLTAPQIVERGMAGNDALCSQVLDVFCALLGGFAGNVALTYGARGGLFIGGGIVPRLGDRFFASRFRERFVEKGRFRPYLEAIPTAVITDTLVALTGAAQALQGSAR